MTLTLDPNWQDADAFYEALIAAHDGLSDEASHALDARLILILANQIGDLSTLKEALKAARAADHPEGR